MTSHQATRTAIHQATDPRSIGSSLASGALGGYRDTARSSSSTAFVFGVHGNRMWVEFYLVDINGCLNVQISGWCFRAGVAFMKFTSRFKKYEDVLKFQKALQ